ncbi:MAG: primosomal protein N' [Candidatus Aminicenantes bacterium]|nr:primosomal protein N' [Candidatus Aminicenantes bacterium]
MTVYAEILLPLPLDRTFYYAVPPDLEPVAIVGARALVPFHRRRLTGIIIGLKDEEPVFDFELKSIERILDEKPFFSSSYLAFTRDISRYYFSAWGELLLSALPASFVFESRMRVRRTERGAEYAASDSPGPREKELLLFLGGKTYTSTYLKRTLKISSLMSIINRLEKKGCLDVFSEVGKVKRRRAAMPSASSLQMEMDYSLDAGLLESIRPIVAGLSEGRFRPFLLRGPAPERDGIYRVLIQEARRRNKNVLFLSPEIATTEPWREALEKKIGLTVVSFHSRMSEKEREQSWQNIRSGEAPVVFGPRSALFAPLGDLGLIVVDEEADESYMQWENPVFDARRGAWIRGKVEGIPVVYGAHVPTVETLAQVEEEGRVISFGSERIGPTVQVVSSHSRTDILARPLITAVRRFLEQGERILIFVGKRGFASYLICSACGFVPRCPKCRISLTYHKGIRRLICHYCNIQQSMPDRCPSCRKGNLIGHGAGSEVVEEELKRLFPDRTVARFDSDTAGAAGKQENLVRYFERGKIDILVGTRLLAHQVNISPGSFLAVLNPEVMLTLPDYQAGQRAFLYLSRLIRFLDRGKKNLFMIQSDFPELSVIDRFAAGDTETYLTEEREFRELMGYPPSGQMIELLLSGDSPRSVSASSRLILRRLREETEGVEVLGPSFVSRARIAGQHKVQFVLKAPDRVELDAVLPGILEEITIRKKVIVHG